MHDRKCEKARVQSYKEIAEAIQLLYSRIELEILAGRGLDAHTGASESVSSLSNVIYSVFVMHNEGLHGLVLIGL